MGISDILYSAVIDLKEYLNKPIQMYSDDIIRKVNILIKQMNNIRKELDRSPYKIR